MLDNSQSDNSKQKRTSQIWSKATKNIMRVLKQQEISKTMNRAVMIRNDLKSKTGNRQI